MATRSTLGHIAIIAAWIIGGFVTLLLLAMLYLVFIFDWSKGGEYASAKMSEILGRESAVEGKIQIEFGWPVTTAHIETLRIANMEGSKDGSMLTTKNLILSADLSELVQGRMAFPLIDITQPNLLLEKDTKGNANWYFSDNPAGAAAESVTPDDRTEVPLIGRLIIRDGTLRYRDNVENIDTTMKVNTLKGSADEGEKLQMKGKGTFNGRAFALNVTGGSVLTLRENEKPYPLDADTTIGTTHATLKGTLTDPFAFAGLDLSLKLRGQDAADLFPILGIALPNTPPYHVTGQLGYERDAKTWTFTGFEGAMGDSDLRGDLRWDTNREKPMLTATFVSNKLDMDDLAGFIGATPDIGAGETASPEQKVMARKEAADPYVLPDATLDIERISAMDANVTFDGKKLISDGLPMDDFHLKAKLENRILKLMPVQFGTANGDIIATITINAQTTPVKVNTDVDFKKLSLARIFADTAASLGIPNETAGHIGGRAKLKGTGDSIRAMLANASGTVGLAMEGGQLSNLIVELMGLDIAESLGFLLSGDQPVPVQCIVGDFIVHQGVMRTQTFVIDTSDTNIKGEGVVNLKDETIDMTLHPHPKDPSILSARSPLEISGTLKHPDVGVSTAELLARGGAAAALAIATPIASLLAFIEPGLGEDSNCVQLLRQNEDVQKGNNPAAPKPPAASH